MKQYGFLPKQEKANSSCPEPSDKPYWYRGTLDHLIQMGLTKGWEAYTWHRVKSLESDPSGAWRGIQAMFLSEIKDAKAKNGVDQIG